MAKHVADLLQRCAALHQIRGRLWRRMCDPTYGAGGFKPVWQTPPQDVVQHLAVLERTDAAAV